ncbi:MAG TPA: ATP-binding cassette domain-containing protein [Gaiellaceae bacterium]|nr:ATP-binding cassette domain-containing protein [Gaiellaceae bacterium]
MSRDSLVTCQELSKTYDTPSGGIEALRSVDAEFALGEITAIVGSSGSGKSTLLRALAGLDRPSSGELLISGRDLGVASPRDLRRHRRERVTYVSQKAADNFIPHLTLAEHARDLPHLGESLLADVGLGERMDAKPIELSGGEQARAAFALALARETPLVVADEPTAELDRDSAELLLEAIRRHAGTGRALVVATHDPDVTAIADSVLHLERGRVVDGGMAVQAQGAAAPAAPPGAEDAVEARGLSRSFMHGGERVHAVRDASFTLRRGEIGILLGRSGSGKSTILTLLAGWHPPDSGEILWAGEPINPATLPWAELGYLPQRFGLIPELTARENIELPARLTGRRDELAPRIDHLLEELGLTELAARVPAETSIGQQQRIALARALVLSPRLLLADEPSSHQDAGWHDAVWQLLAEAATEGTACLAATHEEDATQYATHVWRIAEGLVEAG